MPNGHPMKLTKLNSNLRKLQLRERRLVLALARADKRLRRLPKQLGYTSRSKLIAALRAL